MNYWNTESQPLVDCLAATGGGSVAPMVMVVGVAAVAMGAAILLFFRAKGGNKAYALVPLLLAAVAFGGVDASPASASDPCAPPAATAEPTVAPTIDPPTPTPTPTTTTRPEPLCESDKSETTDTDGDGFMDCFDLDSDNDGIPDQFEEVTGTDQYANAGNDIDFNGAIGDGTHNYLDLDSDNDGWPDLWESGISESLLAQLDTDHNGIIGDNGENVDFTDGIASVLLNPDGTLIYLVRDTDGDGSPDFLDVISIRSMDHFDIEALYPSYLELDTDGSGQFDGIVDVDQDGIIDVADADTTRRGGGNLFDRWGRVTFTPPWV